MPTELGSLDALTAAFYLDSNNLEGIPTELGSLVEMGSGFFLFVRPRATQLGKLPF